MSSADPGEVGCAKPDLDDVVGVREKMELAAAMVSSEVEKNVQMQALSKFKATITKVSYMIEFYFGEGKGYLFKYS